MFVWNAHEGAVTSLAFGPDGRFLVSGSSDEQVKVWEPFTGAEQSRISLTPPDGALFSPIPLRWLALSGDGNWAVVHQHSRRLVFLDLEYERIKAELNIPHIHALKRTPDGETIALLLPATSAIPPEFRRYYFDSQFDPYTGVTGYSPLSQALAFSPDGRRLAIGASLHPWPPAANGRVGHIDMKKYEPEDLAFSADNEHLFALVGGKVVVYSLTTCLFKTKLKGHCGQITAMQLAPDGRRLWTASRDATVKCWDTHALTLDRTFRFDTGGLDCLAISPDGNVAAVGSAQKGTITVWDLG